MMLDRILAAVAFATLAGFIGIFVFNVPKPALIVVVLFVLALVARDFCSQLGFGRRR